MSKNRMLSTRFWSDSWIVDELNPLDRYLLLYLMLNERTTISGVYELPIRIMASEVGLEKEEVSRMLKRLEPKVFYRQSWVIIANAIKHQNYKNTPIQLGIQRELCRIPSEFFEFLSIPDDFDMDFSCPVEPTSVKTTKKEAEKGSPGESYRTPGVPNLTKPNLTKPNAMPDKPAAAANAAKAARGFKKPTRAQYQRAVKADEALAKKENAAKKRKPNGRTKSASELFGGK